MPCRSSPLPKARWPHRQVAALLTSGAIACGGNPATAAPGSCSVTLASNGPVRISDWHVMMIPEAVSENFDGKVLLLGQPTVLWQRDSEGEVRALGDSAIGVVFRPEQPEHARAVLPPDGMASSGIGAFRALAQPDGSWLVFMVQYTGQADQPFWERKTRELWQLRLDAGLRWTDRQAVPLAGAELDWSTLSEPLESGSTLWIAGREGSGRGSRLIVLSRAGNTWSVARIPSGTITYPTLVRDSGGGVELIAATSGNVLQRFSLNPWQPLEVLSDSSTEPAHRPWAWSGATSGVAWSVGMPHSGRVGAVRLARPAQPIPFGPSVGPFDARAGAQGPMVVQATMRPENQLRFFGIRSGRVIDLGATPSPFEPLSVRIVDVDSGAAFLLGAVAQQEGRDSHAPALEVRRVGWSCAEI